MSEDIKPKEEETDDIFEEDETDDSNLTKGDDTDDEALSLAEYNQRVGKNYKSWDDIYKREKEADKAFAKGEHKEKKEEPKVIAVNDEIIEELLLTKHPEASYVIDELRNTASLKGISVLKLFRESKYFQGEAKQLSDAEKSKEEAKSKIKQPTNGSPLPKKDISSIKPEDVATLKPSEKIEWIKAMAEKERRSDD